MHAISPRFTILNAGSTVNSSDAASAAVGAASTVSISGGPNPTAVFAATFSAIAGSAIPRWEGGRGLVAMGVSLVFGMVGAVWIVL